MTDPRTTSALLVVERGHIEEALEKTQRLGEELTQAMVELDELVRQLGAIQELAERLSALQGVARAIPDRPLSSLGRHELEQEVLAWREAWGE